MRITEETVALFRRRMLLKHTMLSKNNLYFQFRAVGWPKERETAQGREHLFEK